MANPTGANIIARALRNLGVTVIFSLVGIPVADIAEEAIDLGIRFIGFRNEQAASYAASVYGYMMGKPGVCLLVGGPGILHGIAGVRSPLNQNSLSTQSLQIGNATANAFPMLCLGGSSETYLHTKGGFQEMDSISLLTPHTKTAIRPHTNSPDAIVSAIHNAYRVCSYGRAGTGFVDLPGDLIMEPALSSDDHNEARVLTSPPKPSADPLAIFKAVQILKSAKAPLTITGKGSAYARAENSIRKLIESTQIPFLPTPMGKGVVPDSHPLNASSARSAALKNADVALLLGARLNEILHFGQAPKWSTSCKIIQVDIHAEEIGHNAGDASLGLVGDIYRWWLISSFPLLRIGNITLRIPLHHIHPCYPRQPGKIRTLQWRNLSRNSARCLLDICKSLSYHQNCSTLFITSRSR